MKHEFLNLIDFKVLQALSDRFCDIVSISSAIIDVNGKILITSGWQDICAKFHRVHPPDQPAVPVFGHGHGQPDNKYVVYKFRNGLLDAAAPIFIEGLHVTNLFMGQFFSSEPDVSYFRLQALKYNFDMTSYLAALKKVPIFGEQKVKSILEYFAKFAEHLGGWA